MLNERGVFDLGQIRCYLGEVRLSRDPVEHRKQLPKGVKDLLLGWRELTHGVNWLKRPTFEAYQLGPIVLVSPARAKNSYCGTWKDNLALI